MSEATIHASTLSTAGAARHRAWAPWQWCTAIALLVGLCALCDVGLSLFNMEPGSWWIGFFTLWMGVWLAQPTALAVWAVLGPGPLRARLPRATLLAAGVALATLWGIQRNGTLPNAESQVSNLSQGLVPLALFLMMLIPLAVARRWLSWRLVPPPGGPALWHRRTSQFGMQHLFLWTAGAAVVFGLGVYLVPEAGSAGAAAWAQTLFGPLAFGAIAVTVLLPTVPLCGLVLAPQRRWRNALWFFLGFTAVSAASYAALYWLARQNPGIGRPSEVALTIACAQIGHYASLLLILLVLHTAGLRLLRGRTTRTSSDDVPPGAQTLDHLEVPTTALPLRLRGYVLVIASLALLCTAALWLTGFLEPVRRDNAITMEWSALGAGVTLENGRLTQASFLPNKPVLDAALEKLGTAPDLRYLSFSSSKVTDEQLKHLAELTQIDVLLLDGTPVTDAGLKHLARLANLKYLSLDTTAVKGTGLKHLEGLTQLTTLNLSNTAVTDAGLKNLEGLTRLNFLDLSNTAVTNAGLKHLEGLNRLVNLNLMTTKTTPAGRQRLKNALPDCFVAP